MQFLIEKTSADYQDKLNALGEELVRVKKEFKIKSKSNEEFILELNDLKMQLKQKDLKIKKLNEENLKLTEDGSRFVTKTVYGSDNKSSLNNESVESLRRQVRLLEEKLKRQRPAERPYEQQYTSRSKSPKNKSNDSDEKEPKVIIR